LNLFALLSLVAMLLVLFAALRFRGRIFAAFVLVLLGLQTATGALLAPEGGLALLPIGALHATVYAHLLALVWARMRSPAWRWLVSVPAHLVLGGSFLALPWTVGAWMGVPLPFSYAPWLVSLLGLLHSLWMPETQVEIVLDGGDRGPRLRRHRSPRDRSATPLRIVQISDPHLGPWMSEARLARICARAVARGPDLIVLTGDFLTMESNRDPDALGRALRPLSALEGRVFACLGNHDLEALDTVRRGLGAAGIRLLVDEAASVETAAGRVQILGADFRWRRRREHLEGLVRAHPRREGELRLLLLHDPSAFRLLPPGLAGEETLVLSGHTHGGQLGLVSLGLRITVLWPLFRFPDHGLFARGVDRLYVHRGTGHYGFPLRLGVPAEQSLLRIHRLELPATLHGSSLDGPANEPAAPHPDLPDDAAA